MKLVLYCDILFSNYLEMTVRSVEILNCPMPKVMNPKNEKGQTSAVFAWVDRLIVGVALSFDNIVIYSNLECKMSILMVVKLPVLIGSATDGAHDAPTTTINNDYSQSTPHVPIGVESTLHKTLQGLWCRHCAHHVGDNAPGFGEHQILHTQHNCLLKALVKF
jgi:hypothetical protein